jgi:hydrogenase maturation protease
VALRIIGCGNVDRGDDAAGVLVARRLRELGVETIEQSGESFSLMESWIGSESVVVVDATAPCGKPGHIAVWNARADRLPEDAFPCSSHAFGVREAVELARVMKSLPKSLIIYGIEGEQFSFGEPLSPEVERAVETVAQRLYALVRDAAEVSVLSC